VLVIICWRGNRGPRLELRTRRCNLGVKAEVQPIGQSTNVLRTKVPGLSEDSNANLRLALLVHRMAARLHTNHLSIERAEPTITVTLALFASLSGRNNAYCGPRSPFIGV